ncbi:MAG: hypothetical protein U0166_03085 [Acidobacteriota bacterium]
MALRTKPVYRNKEDTLTLHGLPVPVVVLVAFTVMGIGYVWGLLKGALGGGLVFVAAYALVAGKPPFWATYIGIYLVRRWTVVSAAAPPPEKPLSVLSEARRRHEA